MGLGQGELQIGAWDGGKKTGKKMKESAGKKKKTVKRVEDEQPGCWIKFPLMGSCMSSRSKVDTSISSASTRCGEYNFCICCE
jgi:hypothetical protein